MQAKNVDMTDFVSIAEASEASSISPNTLRKWAQNGEVDAQKVSPRLWLVSLKSAVNQAKKSASLPRAGRPMRYHGRTENAGTGTA